MLSDEQLAAICAEFGESGGQWSDSFCLEPLLCDAKEQGVLPDVWIYQLLDGRDVDLFLVSVEIAPAVFVHSMPVNWHEVRPEPSTLGEAAVRQALERLSAVADGVRTRFLHEVAEVVSAAVMPGEGGMGRT